MDELKDFSVDELLAIFDYIVATENNMPHSEQEVVTKYKSLNISSEEFRRYFFKTLWKSV